VGGGGNGSGIVLWAETDVGCVFGASALGSKGTDPEAVGDEAAQELIRGLRAGGCVDEYMQVIPNFLFSSRTLLVLTSGLSSLLGPDHHLPSSRSRNVGSKDWYTLNTAYEVCIIYSTCSMCIDTRNAYQNCNMGGGTAHRCQISRRKR
jgi:RNA 3'-terminal phosphate cyclase (RTC), insert domain